MTEEIGTTMEEQTMDTTPRSAAEREEMEKLGIVSTDGDASPYVRPSVHEHRPPIDQRAIHAPDVLNEAYDYRRPSSFSRATAIPLGDYKLVLISGTSSVDDQGFSVHIGDFRAQCWRTYRNITRLLEAEGMSWHDVIRTTCYLRDIERDYRDFNEVRTAFFNWMALDPLPASTGIQARLCREDLLIEMEAMAVVRRTPEE